MNEPMIVVDETLDDSQDDDIGDLASDEDLLGPPPDEVGSPSVRSVIFKFLDEPASSPAAKYYAMFQTLVLLLYIVLLCYSSVYHKHRGRGKIEINDVFVLDTVVTVIFTLDYVIRLVCVRDMAHLREFLTDGMNIVDVLSIIPYYIVLAPIHPDNIEPLRALRVIRLVRIFRLYRLYRHRSTLLRVFIRALERAQREIYFLFALLAIVSVFFGTAIYYVETSSCDVVDGSLVYTHGPHKGQATAFQDIPASFWWAIVTTAGVGYGDMFPITIGGKVVATGLMFGSFLIVAFPVTVLTAAYTSTYEMYRKEKTNRRLGRSIQSSRPPSPAVGFRRRRSTVTGNSDMIRNRARSPSRVSNPAATTFAVTAISTSQRPIRSNPSNNSHSSTSEADGAFVVGRRLVGSPGFQEHRSRRRSSAQLEVDHLPFTPPGDTHTTSTYLRDRDAQGLCSSGCATTSEMREILSELKLLREELRELKASSG